MLVVFSLNKWIRVTSIKTAGIVQPVTKYRQVSGFMLIIHIQ